MIKDERKNKKKVLIFLPGGVGGAERMSVLIGKLLPKERYHVKFVILGKLQAISNVIPKDYDVDCIPVRNIYAFSTLRIWWKIMREKPDLIFASQVAYNSRVIIAAKLAGRPVIIRSSGMVGKYPIFKYLGVRFTYPKANAIIAQQEDMRKEIMHLLKIHPNKVVTIHNPLDYDDLDNLSSEPFPYKADDSINYVESASICNRKAQDVAIRAFAIVKRRIPKAELYFVGHCEEKNSYCQSLNTLIANLNLQESVHFIGFDKNPFRWVKNANCFVFPSRSEGLPNALIEASYLGVPCAATRCLRIVEDIIKDGENGYVVDVDDVEGMANAMMKAINIKQCKMVYKPGTADDFIHIFENIH